MRNATATRLPTIAPEALAEYHAWIETWEDRATHGHHDATKSERERLRDEAQVACLRVMYGTLLDLERHGPTGLYGRRS